MICARALSSVTYGKCGRVYDHPLDRRMKYYALLCQAHWCKSGISRCFTRPNKQF